MSDTPANRALTALLSESWAIESGSLERLIEVVRREHDLDQASERMTQARDRDAYRRVDALHRSGERIANARAAFMRPGGVAVVPVLGPIFRYANLFTELSGATSLEELGRDFDLAAADPRTRAIVLDIDSPGGQASGINEFAKTILAARASVPVVAYVSGLGASAAYWLATAAGQIVADDTAMVGSIGVVMGLLVRREGPGDRFKEIEIISSNAPEKRPDPETDEGRAPLQRRIDRLERIFIDAVAENRGVTPERVINDFGRGGVLVGQDAPGVGMTDAVGTFESVTAALAADPAARFGRSRPRQRLSTSEGAEAMSKTTQTPAGADDKPAAQTETDPKPAAAPPVEASGQDTAAAAPAAAQPDPAAAIAAATADQIRAANPAAVAEIAKAERERIQGVLAQAEGFPGHDALLAELVADGKTTPEAAAAQILAAERNKGDRQLAARRAADEQAAAVRPAPAADAGAMPDDASDPEALTDEALEARWSRMTGEQRAAYGTDADAKNRFFAVTRAEAQGRVRQFHGRAGTAAG